MPQLCCLKIIRLLWPIRTWYCYGYNWIYCKVTSGHPVDGKQEANKQSCSQNNIKFRTDTFCQGRAQNLDVGVFPPLHAWLYPSRADGSDVIMVQPAKRILSLIFSQGPWIPTLRFTLKQAQPFSLQERNRERRRMLASLMQSQYCVKVTRPRSNYICK